jgi:hypothetical protein
MAGTAATVMKPRSIKHVHTLRIVESPSREPNQRKLKVAKKDANRHPDAHTGGATLRTARM